MTTRHFLTLLDLTPAELGDLIRRAIELKSMHRAGAMHEPLKNRVLAMVFEKSSTRTRVSFEAGMAQLGGTAIFLSPRDTQLGRGEPIEDSARETLVWAMEHGHLKPATAALRSCDSSINITRNLSKGNLRLHRTLNGDCNHHTRT